MLTLTCTVESRVRSGLTRALESRRAVQAGMSKTEILRYIEQDREKVRS